MHLAGAKQTKKQKKKHNIQSDIVPNIHICQVTILCILSGKIIKKKNIISAVPSKYNISPYLPLKGVAWNILYIKGSNKNSYLQFHRQGLSLVPD